MFVNKKKFNFTIGISLIREENDKNIDEKIKSNKDNSLSENEKRLEVLRTDKSTTYKKSKIDNYEIDRNIKIQEKNKDIKDPYENSNEKINEFIKEENDLYKEKVINETNIIQNKNILIYQDKENKLIKINKNKPLIQISEIREQYIK